MAKQYKNVEQILKLKGAMLSSKVSQIFQDQGLSAAAARQRIFRRSASVKTLHGLPFTKNAKFLYLEGEFGTPKFFDNLLRELEESAPGYAAALYGLAARGGICLVKDWNIVSGSPVLQKGHVSSEEVLKRLKSVKLLEQRTIAGIGDCVVLALWAENINFGAFRARLTLERIAIDTVRQWAVRMGFSSKDTIKTRFDNVPAKFSTFSFDIVGPSYLKALMVQTKTGPKNGFFVADVVWADELREMDAKSFLRKIATLSALKNLGRFQPMLVSDGFTRDAIMACRAKGVMAVTVDTLLGRGVAIALRELLDVLTRAAQVAIGNPGKIDEIFDKLSTVEGLSGNLRGAMFELIVGHIAKDLLGGSIDIGEIATNATDNSRADIDVRQVGQDQVTCIECKGYDSDNDVSLEEVKYWLEKQVPIIRAYHAYQQRFVQKIELFEFWTTARFSNEAKAYLKERKTAIKKYQIGWKEGREVLTEARRLSSRMIFKTLKTHYFEKTPTKVLGLTANQ